MSLISNVPTEGLRLLRKQVVCELTSLSAPTIWRLVREGKFPPAIRIAPGRVAWRASDIEEWLTSRATVGTVGA
jgi:prophage regulatory protein